MDNQVLLWDPAVAARLGKDLAVLRDNLERNNRLLDQHRYNFGHQGFQVFQRSLGILRQHRKKQLDSLREKGTSRLDHSLEDTQIQAGSLRQGDILVVVKEGT